MSATWTHTKSALSELENLLLCGYCNELVENPKSLSNCEHFFCSTCIEKNIGNTCPSCSLPSNVKSTNRQLENAVSLCQNLSFLLMRDTLNLPDTPARNAESERKPSTKKSNIRHSIEVKLTRCKTTTTKVKKTSTTPKRGSRGRALIARVSTSRTQVETDADIFVAEESLDEPRRQLRSKRRLILPEAENIAPSSLIPPLKLETVPTDVIAISPKISCAASSSTLMSPTITSRVKTQPCKTPTNRKSASNKVAGRIALSYTPTAKQDTRTANCFTPSNRTPGSSQGRGQATPAHLRKNHKGETPLQVAVIKGDLDKAKTLIEQGAEVNTKDNAGWTPLHEASSHGYVNLVDLLLESGAVINVPGCDNETPLHDAVSMNRLEVVRLLISRGADKAAKNRRGLIPENLTRNKDMLTVLDETDADSQLDESVMVVPSQLAVGPVVLLVTGLPREDRGCVQRCATLLHGRTEKDYCNEVTHLVTSVNRDGQCPRTLKFLQTLLLGKWIVNKEWVETCLEYNERVSEEPFEVPGCSTNPGMLAPQRARLNALQKLPGLFDGCHFFLQGPFSYPTPSRVGLSDLILAGGGRLLSRLPKAESIDDCEVTVPYHAKPDSTLNRCSHYIIIDSRKGMLERLHPRLCRTNSIWLLDCIARFELIDQVAVDGTQ